MPRRALVVAMTLLCCTACAGPTGSTSFVLRSPTSPTSPVTPGGDPLDDPASPHQIRYGAGITSDPLPTPAPAIAVTAEQAVAAVNRPPDQAAERTRPEVTLRMVTTGFAPHRVGPRPMWVLTWTGMHARPTGTPQMTAEQSAALAALAARARCVEVEAVDARNSRVYGIWQICHG